MYSKRADLNKLLNIYSVILSVVLLTSCASTQQKMKVAQPLAITFSEEIQQASEEDLNELPEYVYRRL